MATARPWYHFVQERVIAQSDDPDSPGIATTERDDDAALIVAAVNAYDTLRAENARLRGALASVLASLPETFDDLDEAKAAIAPHRR